MNTNTRPDRGKRGRWTEHGRTKSHPSTDSGTDRSIGAVLDISDYYHYPMGLIHLGFRWLGKRYPTDGRLDSRGSYLMNTIPTKLRSMGRPKERRTET